MATKVKNTVKTKPATKSKAAAKPLPIKVLASDRSKSAPTVKAVPSAQATAKIANKNPVAKTEVTTAKVVKARKLSKANKPKKIKMVRDSFSMPENEYSQFAALKMKCLSTGVHVKKSELLRAGLLCLSKLSDSELVNIVGQVEILKTGRPIKH
ncbi:conserved hypothetical protein [Candidatus Nitrotoga sp. HW29]|uniref:hypothetical protein n=1 Tax=Candidatus Nitrotoga sp. HW29 TaxID=2886963 RepID=UPI001EF19306|nr:hypothetical protein [Candidatus Nitrotoga sp. HW29]CAH1905671.1 conserved hypothetical protein [Candidatus Nitrotoga sp. HW29]